jgi:hypothetical protein
MYYVYILLSLKDNKFYIGFTSNLKRRLKEHNYGKNISTKSRLPLKLIYEKAGRMLRLLVGDECHKNNIPFKKPRPLVGELHYEAHLSKKDAVSFEDMQHGFTGLYES